MRTPGQLLCSFVSQVHQLLERVGDLDEPLPECLFLVTENGKAPAVLAVHHPLVTGARTTVDGRSQVHFRPLSAEYSLIPPVGPGCDVKRLQS